MNTKEILEAAAFSTYNEYHQASKANGTYEKYEEKYTYWKTPADPTLEDFTDEWGEVVEHLSTKGFSFEWEGEQHFVKQIDQHGGEGEGDDYYYVYEVDGKTFMLQAYYSSWEGVSWEDAVLYEVKPVEKTITVWVAK